MKFSMKDSAATFRQTMDEKVFKIVVVGNMDVGKTSLINRYSDDVFENEKVRTYGILLSIGIDFKRKIVSIRGEQMKFNLWDTAGHQDYRMVTANFLKGCSSIILVTSCQSLDKTDDIELWMETIASYASETPLIFLMANKCDLLSDEEKKRADEIVQSHKMSFNFSESMLVDLCHDRCQPKQAKVSMKLSRISQRHSTTIFSWKSGN